MHDEPEHSFSSEDRELLRDSVRGQLLRSWPAEQAVESSSEPAQVRAAWRELCEQGLGALGADPGADGWRETLLVLEELGRSARPAPMLETALANNMLALYGDAATDLLSGVHSGETLLALALGSYDGDANAGQVDFADGHLSGTVAFVEGLEAATHLLVTLDGACGIAIVPKHAAGIRSHATPGLGAPLFHTVSFDRTPALALAVPSESIEDYARLARLAMLARSLGAAQRSFELVVEHVKTRKQFGQVIGRFQAIQHKLANCLISLEASRLMLERAAELRDRGNGDWRVAGSAAFAFAAPALRQVALEIHHAFGAIGYSEEHEAPRHFRRVFADLARFGGARRAREELAAYQLRGHGAPMPDFDLGTKANAFRAEVRAWLADHWGAEAQLHERQKPFHTRGIDSEFSRTLGRKGWIAVSWPREYGGLGLGPLEQFAFVEEMAHAGAPTGAHSCASEIIGPALIAFGTPEQKERFLPAFLRGEITFSLGYSESEAGSDLANLRTSAIREGDEWVINGEKLWTSRGDVAHYHWLAARSDPHASPKHAGITMFMVPLGTPGITIRTSMAMYGYTFSAVHYDNVRIPNSARVGAVNGGWKVIAHALASERIVMGSYVAAIRSLFDALIRHAATASEHGRALRDDPILRDRLGGLAAEIEAARHLAVNGVMIGDRGRVPVHEAAMSKVYSGELLQRVTQAAIDLLGAVVILGEESAAAVAQGRIEQLLRRSIMMVVGGGTAEVQRTLIAQRGLGLPR